MTTAVRVESLAKRYGTVRAVDGVDFEVAHCKTVILSSHFMVETERLCDRVAIMDRGKLATLDAPDVLVREYGSTYAGEFQGPDPHALACAIGVR